LRASPNVRLGLISSGSTCDLNLLAHRLGADFSHQALTPRAKADLIRQWTLLGRRVAYVGDCDANSEAARVAHATLSTLDLSQEQDVTADANLMQPEWERVGRLWEIARARDRRNRVTHGFTVGPNLMCVAGALMLDFSVLSAVLISNLGVFASYCNVSRWLHNRGASPTSPRSLVRSEAKNRPHQAGPARALRVKKTAEENAQPHTTRVAGTAMLDSFLPQQ
jgi:Cu2+-exporting ATPase